MSATFDPDQAAAHYFLTELRTRISTQPLPYQHGVEARALESLWEVFAQARMAIQRNPGCEKFAARTTHVLNRVVRPLTAKWHRALAEGRLNGRDGADEFRGELRKVQQKLHKFARALHKMAYGKPRADFLAPDVMGDRDLAELFAPLGFGFRAHATQLQAQAVEIAKDEADAVAKRRQQQGIKTAAGNDAIGLALSGGGIRSATFGLGVVQVLAKAERNLLKEMDFLSTVSGGGYTGCFLTQWLGKGETHDTVAGAHGPDPDPVRYVRQHARYLSGNLREKWGMVTATLAGMLLNWAVPLLVIVLLAVVASLADAQGVQLPWRLLLAMGGGLCALMMVVYGWSLRVGRKSGLVMGRVLGVLLAFTTVVGMGWVVESTFPSLLQTMRGHWARTGVISSALAAVAAAAPGIIRFLPVLKKPKVRKLALKCMLGMAGLLVPLAALLLFYAFRGIAGLQSDLWEGSTLGFLGKYLGVVVLVCAALVCAIVSIFVLDINLTGPHRLYRDCLARTFIQNTPSDTADATLADINPAGTAPYHLLNAALNVPSSETATLKDRGCDFFLFSKEWTGSTATGYHRTREWKVNRKGLDLATAMAVSGAAISPHLGLASRPTLTALLTLLNVRLGIWIKKPKVGGFSAPGFLCLLREMTGIAMSEKRNWLHLSDGGHIENLGVYELLRRRCKFIICVDGEADSAYTFQGLMTLVRHAQIDFGVCIEPKLDDLRPDPATGYSKCHFHLCRIHYPPIPAPTPAPEGVGLLLYVKLSVTGNEPELIRRYRINNPDFPHQSTLDQFFDEEQFEAYRQLGVHVAEGLFLPALMSGANPQSVREWFQQLAKNLLEPRSHQPVH